MGRQTYGLEAYRHTDSAHTHNRVFALVVEQ